MTRTSEDEIIDGHTCNGFDYALQVWVKNYIRTIGIKQNNPNNT